LSRIEADGVRRVDIGALDLPEGIRDVIVRRLHRLPDGVNNVLEFAAVVGRDFNVELLARATGESTAHVLKALDDATAAGLVQREPMRMGSYRFSHGLISQTLNVVGGAARRAQLHARTGAAKEEAETPYPAAELALHFTHAVPLVGAR